MNCPTGMDIHCPSAAEQKAMAASIHKGHITWTALPWNGQLELMDPFTLASATHVTFYLDNDLQVPHKTVISQVCRLMTELIIVFLLLLQFLKFCNTGTFQSN
jgi:hypothetical protein